MTTLENRTAPPSRREDAQAPEHPVGHTTGWWGMALLVSTEATTFAVFLASYFYIRFASAEPWPPPSEELPGLLWPSLATAALILSCVPMAVAVRAAPRDRRGAMGLTLALTWVLGAAFLLLQVVDWMAEWPKSTLSKDAYGSLFYTITGLHTVHVAVGLLMLMALLASTARGRLGRRRPEPLGIVAMYWYFLAVLAVAIYVCVYISPYL